MEGRRSTRENGKKQSNGRTMKFIHHLRERKKDEREKRKEGEEDKEESIPCARERREKIEEEAW